MKNIHTFQELLQLAQMTANEDYYIYHKESMRRYTGGINPYVRGTPARSAALLTDE
jgi:hypothetical protein